MEINKQNLMKMKKAELVDMILKDMIFNKESALEAIASYDHTETDHPKIKHTYDAVSLLNDICGAMNSRTNHEVALWLVHAERALNHYKDSFVDETVEAFCEENKVEISVEDIERLLEEYSKTKLALLLKKANIKFLESAETHRTITRALYTEIEELKNRVNSHLEGKKSLQSVLDQTVEDLKRKTKAFENDKRKSVKTITTLEDAVKDVKKKSVTDIATLKEECKELKQDYIEAITDRDDHESKYRKLSKQIDLVKCNAKILNELLGEN